MMMKNTKTKQMDTGCYYLFLVVKGDDVGLVFSYDSDGLYFEVGNIQDIIKAQLAEPKDSC